MKYIKREYFLSIVLDAVGINKIKINLYYIDVGIYHDIYYI